MYGQNGAISSWRELKSAAITVRSMLGVSPSAYQDACYAMGPEMAAAATACILEGGGHISSAGGYLRDLTRRARKGEFSLGPMLMALERMAELSRRRDEGRRGGGRESARGQASIIRRSSAAVSLNPG
ncbi:hypothetical protein ASC96_27440 [Rhizobium sp. Root1204]|nr:hypothetical protein ASC96_27440 [Rhizobium sp. Root1204]